VAYLNPAQRSVRVFLALDPGCEPDLQLHHVIPIAQVGTEYELHPIRDLRPVCPNCHAVIHRREPPFSIEEIKHMLQNHGAKGSPEGVRDVRRRTRMPNKGSAADTRG
jgi:hypothetical protein